MNWLKLRTYVKGYFYDDETKKIIRRVLGNHGNGLDVGCHKGEILDYMLRASPNGKHMGIEPIPNFASALREKYRTNEGVSIIEGALGSIRSVETFQYVTTNPAFSGLKRRSYVRIDEVIEEIQVDVITLDSLWPANEKLSFIKIDVEGGELGVLLGGIETIKRFKPVIIFEHGKGAAEHYETGPLDIFSFFESLNYEVSLMRFYLKGKAPLRFLQFEQYFNDNREFYFVAYPKSK
jgi:FkbM family methyltransferase